jgi:hypothetical protein
MYRICYTASVSSGIPAEDYFAERRTDPEYESEYQAASRRIGMFDDAVRALEERRQELKLSKADLARRADLPPAAVRRLLSQQHKNPTLTTLVAIADALHLRLSFVSNEATSAHPDGGSSGVGLTEHGPGTGTHRRTA